MVAGALQAKLLQSFHRSLGLILGQAECFARSIRDRVAAGLEYSRYTFRSTNRF